MVREFNSSVWVATLFNFFWNSMFIWSVIYLLQMNILVRYEEIWHVYETSVVINPSRQVWARTKFQEKSNFLLLIQSVLYYPLMLFQVMFKSLSRLNVCKILTNLIFLNELQSNISFLHPFFSPLLFHFQNSFIF